MFIPIGINGFESLSKTDLWLSSYEVTATLDDKGDMHMEEIVVANNSEDYHTFFMDIGYDKSTIGVTNYDRASFDEDSFRLTVIDNKNETVYENISQPVSDSNGLIGFSWTNSIDELGDPIVASGDCERILVHLKNGTDPKTTYKLSYTLKGVVSSYQDISVLNWKLAPSFDMTKLNVKVTLNLPDNKYNIISKDQEDGLEGIYLYGHGSSNASFTKQTSTQVVMEADRLSETEEIELRALFPTPLFPNIDSKNTTSEPGFSKMIAAEEAIYNEEMQYVSIRNIFVYGVPVVGAIFIAILVYLTFTIYKKYDKEHVSTFDDEYYRELPAEYPPAVMGYLYNFKEIGKDDLNATLMDLIRRKYIEVDYSGVTLTDKNPDYTLILNEKKTTEGLLSYEKLVIEWYFTLMAKGNKTLKLSEIDEFLKKENNAIQYNKYNAAFIAKVKEESFKEKFFDDDVETKSKKHIGVSLLGFFICAAAALTALAYNIILNSIISGLVFALSFAFMFYVDQIKRRSIKGNEDYVRWKAFKHFLEEFSHFEDYPVPGVEVWEHYLVYATSFGIAELVEKQLRTRFKQLSREEEFNASPILYYHYSSYFHYRVIRSMTISRTTIQTAQQQRMQNSSHGGGRGGFGGGSSFGGGGGRSMGGR